jgi:hypothetical protein
MELGDLRPVLRHQSGLVSRLQVVAAGGTDNDLRRWVRRRQLWRVHPGVYVVHSGPLSWDQRAWAAVLVCSPAALAGSSALRAHGLRGHACRDGDPIEVIVPPFRRVLPPAGVRVTRRTGFELEVQLHLSPPRQRLETAVVGVAARAPSVDAAVAVAADAVQSGRTTVERLRAALPSGRAGGRLRVLEEILGDIASGAYSALEVRYLRDVERAHGLPSGRRQRRVTAGQPVHYRDVEYLGLGTLVELDGRLGHEWSTDRWADLDRDLANAVAGELTLRAGWRQVLHPCRLAAVVGGILLARGWPGPLQVCRPGCRAVDGGSQSPDDLDLPLPDSA